MKCILFFVFLSGSATPDKVMFSKDDIPASFMLQHMLCAKTFKLYQQQTIMSNLNLYHAVTEEKATWLEKAREYCVQIFIDHYGIWRIKPYERLMYRRCEDVCKMILFINMYLYMYIRLQSAIGH